MERDCCITQDNQWFRYRAAAIIVEDGCVLFAGNEKEDYLYSIGGGVHLGEAAEDAVRREVLEETGIPYEIDRLAFIHENFFFGNSGLAGFECHEVAFYFLMKSRGSQTLNSHSVTSGGIPETMHWIPIDQLDRHLAYPPVPAGKAPNHGPRDRAHRNT